ncbi:MAG: UTP--glucose-1-phosphate uridylyltransferase GalU [Bacteriovoracaceae bacterium]
MKIRTAVIPVAGKGTRFLPATKQTPKEMLPILNVPMIHYIVEEAVQSGIEKIVFVTSTGKHSIAEYFDRNFELEAFLEEKGKVELKEQVKNIGEMIEIVTVHQKEQLGLGHAVLCAEGVVKDGAFAVLLGDDMVLSDDPNLPRCTKQLLDYSAQNNGANVIGVMEVDPNLTYKYGIVDGEKVDDRGIKMKRMVEKPKPEEAPTNLATPGRYILRQEIFEILKKTPKGVGGEIQLTDAINEICKQGNTYAYKFEGERFDTGSLPGYLKATIHFAMRNPDTKETMKEILESYS